MHQEKSIRSPNASCPARLVSATRRTRKGRQVKLEQLAYALACSLCLVGCLAPVRPVECGRLQDFIQNLVGGGGGGSSSSSSGSGQSSSASSSNGASSSSSDSSDSDTAASGEASNEQPMTPMMSAMNPFMRFPSYYDSFAPSSFGAFPGMSFSSPMGAMSALAPMTMSAAASQSLGGAFSPASFGPSSFGSAFGSSASGPSGLSAFGSSAMGAPSSLSNVYAQAGSPSLLAGYAPYYGRRK